MAILSRFSMALPRFEVLQDHSVEWMGLCHAASDAVAESVASPGLVGAERATDWTRLFQRFGVKSSQVSSRRTECQDVFTENDWDQKTIYRLTPGHPSGVDIEQRTLFFAERAREIFRQFYTDDVTAPQHLVHVTCTGYISPSAPQTIVAEKNWSGGVGVTHAYHMGCYAALPSIRIAAALSSEVGRVDVVHTEMCTLHMNPAIHTPEQMVVQSLFADGHIKYSVTKELPTDAKIGLKILAIREWILPNSAGDMTWLPAATGMRMTLSREVPEKITAQLRSCFTEMIEDCGLDPIQVLKDSIFAVHPGGPKIIEAVERCLELREDQTRQSQQILRTRGNMSSSTLPHIWQEILESQPAPKTRIVSFAFGPGLTVFASLFEVVSE